jgi:quercetin dioxygenase-like cupin family protein
MIGQPKHTPKARPPGALVSVVRRDERPVLVRGPGRPTLQRLVDRASGSDAVTILINNFTGDQAVPEHSHEVEEVLLVTAGECTIAVNGRPEAAREGDAVIIPPGSSHAIRQQQAIRSARRLQASRP